jgi:hypothetical protein
VPRSTPPSKVFYRINKKELEELKNQINDLIFALNQISCLMELQFRLCNAPSTFITFMNYIFHDKLDKFIIIYIDG